MDDMIATLVGTVFPACKSVRALMTIDDAEDDKIWLTYWVVYGFVCVVDLNIGWILDNFPGYFIIKMLFFLWLQAPLGPLMGARVIYKLIFKPIYMLFGDKMKAKVKETAETVYDYDQLVQQGLKDMQDEAKK